MFNSKRRTRPADFGPYPLETLPRDGFIYSLDAGQTTAAAPPPLPQNDNCLAQATRKYRQIFAELRDVMVFSRKAPDIS